ncbi:MAG TPA: beta-L-arabinofuranosidase domain-containing protein [Kofleriaceae bacterium]|nr:beta-L-arabinofuranosidase domain-containing protein [Kofleriaceae bacterium]
MLRRHFLATTATAAASALLPLRRLSAAAATPRIRPFAPSRVRLRPGPVLDAAEVNRRFILGQDPDRLLHNFRRNAGLASSAAPLGGWEAPDNELRGHYVGHYLSACALIWASAGDAQAKQRGDRIVAALAECQRTRGSGYLSAFPEELFDRLRDNRPAWAPFYTLHKIMAGLLDMHTLAGNAQALEIVKGMARWTARWTGSLGDADMARVLEREYGGMNEVLYNLAAATGEAEWREVAHRFDHERIFRPLAEGRDELKGLHVNTTIPKIIGAARRHELTSEPRYRRIAEYFWRDVTGRRAYATGGTSNGESWGSEPGVLSTELSGYTQECCVTYNLLKLTRHVFAWTGDPVCADYYERALWNGILGTQHPADGSKLYYVSLGSGYWKLFGTPGADYWCCTGSGSESFAKLGDSIYFADDDGLYVNLFIASELAWSERGVTVIQDTRFPVEPRTSLIVKAARPVAFALRVRVPGWTARGGSARLNGKPLNGFAAPGGYLVLDRTWHDGDRVDVSLPMAITTSPMPDDPSLQAILYGPLVLAARMGTAGLGPGILRAGPTRPRTVPEYRAEGLPTPSLTGPAPWVRSEDGKPLAFRATAGEPRELAPLYQIFDERYGVYFKTPS